jgi:hypothetical protein
MRKFHKGDRVRLLTPGTITDGRVGQVEMQWRDEDGTRLVAVFIYGLSYLALAKEDQLEHIEEAGKQLPLGAV